MGIFPGIAEMIVREHLWKSITGQVVTMGRQTILLNPAEAVDLLRACDCAVLDTDVHGLELDYRTRFSQNAESECIRDTDFFRLLGVQSLKAMDVSDYEGAEIIHDLNYPIPPEMEATADFVIDGSTLDNTFSPGVALQNMSRMLRPGGRIVSVSIGANTFCPYVIVTPLWVFDYFVVNGYTDCKVYVMVGKEDSRRWDNFWVFGLDLSRIHRNAPWWDNFKISPAWDYDTFIIVVLAEKGLQSTWDRTPVQHQYRSLEMWDSYERNLASIMGNNRPDLSWSHSKDAVNYPNPLYVYINKYGDRMLAPGVSGNASKPKAAPPGNRTGISIIEATYGWNCKKESVQELPSSWVARGNVTAAVALECDGEEECEFYIDVNKLGDPASGLQKDFIVKWRYGDEEKVYEAHVDKEAHGKVVRISRTSSV